LIGFEYWKSKVVFSLFAIEIKMRERIFTLLQKGSFIFTTVIVLFVSQLLLLRKNISEKG